MSGLVTRTERLAADGDSTADLGRQLGLVLAALTAAAPREVDPAGQTEKAPEDDQHAARLSLDELPALISVSKAATVLGISRASAYRYAACDDLPTVRLGGRLYVVTERLRKFLAAA